ncbi:MAG: glycosyltransferase [Armatimonadetes bacterium]|nr:glycosyltransferase [Armatimonadota bacterium]
MANPKVSIITPAYNHRNLIGACIQSVRNQSFRDWEMIIVDDGSTDGTPEFVESYKDPRIKVLTQPNQGLVALAKSYNRALQASKGELIAILEADDAWPPEKLDGQVSDFDDPAIVLSWGRAMMTDLDGHPIDLIPRRLPPPEAMVNQPVGRASFVMCQDQFLTFAFPVTVMMRRTTVEKIGGFQQEPGMPVVDMATFLKMGLEGPWAFHDRILGYWRRHPDSATKSRFPQILNGAYKLAMKTLSTERERIPATDEEIKLVKRHWDYFQYERLALLGRALASEHRWEEAIAAFNHAEIYKLRPQARALIGGAKAMCSAHVNPEPLFLAVKHKGWQESARLSSGDPVISIDLDINDFIRID